MIPYGNVPKSYKDKYARVHYLTCRKTIYGVHRWIEDSADLSSKTCIVCFAEQRHAFSFKDDLMHIQNMGRILERCIHLPNVIHPLAAKKTKGTFLQVSVESSSMVDMMKMCHMNFFDMYLVFDVNHHDNGDRSFSYYIFNVTDTPARGYLNCHFNHLLEI